MTKYISIKQDDESSIFAIVRVRDDVAETNKAVTDAINDEFCTSVTLVTDPQYNKANIHKSHNINYMDDESINDEKLTVVFVTAFVY